MVVPVELPIDLGAEIAALQAAIDREADATDSLLRGHLLCARDVEPGSGPTELTELDRQLSALRARVARALCRDEGRLSLRAELATLLFFAKTLRADAEACRAAFEEALRGIERREQEARAERERLAAERGALVRRRDALQAVRPAAAPSPSQSERTARGGSVGESGSPARRAEQSVAMDPARPEMKAETSSWLSAAVGAIMLLVARHRTPDRWDSVAEPPPEVQVTVVSVTVVPGTGGHDVRDRIAGTRAVARARLILGLAIVVAVGGVGGIAVDSLQGGRTGAPSGAPVGQARAAGPAGVAAAYRYPLGCLGVTISASDPASASAHLDRASPCWRYGVYVTAIFHRVHRVWRLALEAASSSCPAVSLPAVVRAQLAVCRRTATPASPSSTATSSPSTITLPASSNGPTTCTVYESGYATQVVFQSNGYEVRAECRAWTSNNAGEGYLWGYEPLSASAKTAESTQVCYLTDPQRNVTATVIQDTGFVAVSAVERANGSSACASLLAMGWTEQGGAPTTPTMSTSATGREPHRRGRAT